MFVYYRCPETRALVSFKKYMSPPFPYFKVNISCITVALYGPFFFGGPADHRVCQKKKKEKKGPQLGKHLPFSPSPLRLNIFRLFVILSLTQLYHYTPEIFIFSTATFKYTYRAPLRRIGQDNSANVASSTFHHWNGYSHFRSGLNWFRK